MEENQTFSDPADYISSVEKFPERVDLNKSLESLEYYHKTLFEVGGFIYFNYILTVWSHWNTTIKHCLK